MSCRLWPPSSTALRYSRVEHAFTPGRFVLTLGAVAATILAGTIGFRQTLEEAEEPGALEELFATPLGR